MSANNYLIITWFGNIIRGYEKQEDIVLFFNRPIYFTLYNVHQNR